MEAKAKRFDYLPKFGAKMESDLELEDLERKINIWRSNGVDDPDAVTVGCRKIVERSMRAMLEVPPDERISLNSLIEDCEDEGIIPHNIALKCNEIRTKGNDGAHSVIKTIDAKMVFELLDDYLRWYVSMNYDEQAVDRAADGFEDGVFTPSSSTASATLAKRASNAASLSDDKTIAKEASKAAALEKTENDKFQERLFAIEELFAKADSLTASIQGDVPEPLLDKLGAALGAAKDQAREAEAEIQKVSDRVDEILSEHDYVKRLLGGIGKATDEQFDVMAFPKGSNTKANILKLRGPAGSGKTLCLLAKLIKQTDQGDMSAAFAQQSQHPRALFVCFNKPLKEHVGELLRECGVDGDIEVVSFDYFVNQLVKPVERVKDSCDISWVKGFASDVRYREGQIHYESTKNGFELTKRAMDAIAEKHPDKKDAYYLDSSKTEHLEWMSDELRYLEVVYRSPSDQATQDYLSGAARTGRGSSRNPSNEIRSIIVEVWREYYASLEREKQYTLAQALHRLYGSNQLPSFKAIAVDECQDLSLIAVKVLFKMRENTSDAYLYIAGDEEQKIYKNDFTWKQLDEGASGYTISLNTNKRNSREIALFANRLIGKGKETAPIPPNKGVYVGKWTSAQLESIVVRCRQAGETLAVIAGKTAESLLQKEAKAHKVSPLLPKGLEYDNVVVVYDRDLCDTPEEERKLRYVHFSRARKRLYVWCPDETPELMKAYYADLLPE